MTSKATAPKEAPEERSPFDQIEVETKAGTFAFREMDGEQYDKCVELSTDPETKRVDMIQLLRWLTVKSAAGDNALTADRLNKLPYKARNRVLAEVNDLYFPDETRDLADRLRSMGYTVTAPDEDDSPNS